MPLPPFPGVRIEQVGDMTPAAAAGFLRLRRFQLQAVSADGAVSEPFEYDGIERKALDAVVVVAHYRDEHGTRLVYLRSAIRPPLLWRTPEQRPFPEKESLGNLWEVVAGLVEADECSREGLVRCAQRELEEELGFTVDISAMLPLGPSTFPAPAIIGERHHFFHVEVEPDERKVPTEDGSVLERDAQITAVPLSEALDLVRRGMIEDAKTELCLRRLDDLT